LACMAELRWAHGFFGSFNHTDCQPRQCGRPTVRKYFLFQTFERFGEIACLCAVFASPLRIGRFVNFNRPINTRCVNYSISSSDIKLSKIPFCYLLDCVAIIRLNQFGPSLTQIIHRSIRSRSGRIIEQS
jgi:hypothetical protein